MGASKIVIDNLLKKLSVTKDPALIDELLDKLYECKYLATDWDARSWGFDPLAWMVSERSELARQSKSPEARASNT
jgi:hypothetical protein